MRIQYALLLIAFGLSGCVNPQGLTDNENKDEAVKPPETISHAEDTDIKEINRSEMNEPKQEPVQAQPVKPVDIGFVSPEPSNEVNENGKSGEEEEDVFSPRSIFNDVPLEIHPDAVVAGKPGECREGMEQRDGRCFCGEVSLTPDLMDGWTCIDNSHFLCLSKYGCKRDIECDSQNKDCRPTLKYPKWGYFGIRRNSFDNDIPEIPVVPSGYILAYDRHNQQHAWVCLSEDCICNQKKVGFGKCIVKNGIEKFYPIKTKRFKNHLDGLEILQDYPYRDDYASKYPKVYEIISAFEWYYDNDENYELACSKFQKYCYYFERASRKKLTLATDIYNYDKYEPDKDGIHQMCGDTDVSEMKDLKKYRCEENIFNGSLICDSSEGCLCGDHLILKDTECRNGKQFCNHSFAEWVDEDAISDYECRDKDIACINKDGCKCGNERCVYGSSCVNGQCFCNSKIISLKHREQYYCSAGGLVCDEEAGCDCFNEKTGKNEKCLYHSVCNPDGCFCGSEKADIKSVKHYKDVWCEDNILKWDEEKDESEDSDYDGESCGCNEPDTDSAHEIRLGDLRVIAEEDLLYHAPGCNSLTVNDPKIVVCEDCDDYTFSKLTQFCCNEGYNVDISKECHRNSGCSRPDPFYLDGFPHHIHGIERVASSEDTKVYSLLVHELARGMVDTMSSRWICDEQNCACGENTCRLGDLCQDGQCSPFDGFKSADNLGTALYCQGMHYPYEAPADRYQCDYYRNYRYYWYCRHDEGCVCGEHQCPKGTYCASGQCMCGDEPLREGYRCSSNYQICDSPSCMCGDQPLNSDYACSMGRQICLSENGCVCGEKTCPEKTYCESGQCMCGNELLKPGYECIHHRLVCKNADGCDGCGEQRCLQNTSCTSGQCMCGEEPLREGYRCDKGIVVCDSAACSCGNEPLKDGYLCIRDKQICKNSDGCACGEKTCPLDTYCKSNQCMCNNKIINNINDSVCVNDQIVRRGKFEKQSSYYLKRYDDNYLVYRIEENEEIQDANENHFSGYEYKDCFAHQNAPGDPILESLMYCDLIETTLNNEVMSAADVFVNGWNLIDPAHPIELDYGESSKDEKTGKAICSCGKHIIPCDIREQYWCDTAIAWRCNLEEGCSCGESKCRQSQICIGPGRCI